MKKILLFGLGLTLFSKVEAQISAPEPQWLENIIVEKYYVSTAADSIKSEGKLPVGSATYRVFVDMLPGCKFLFLWGEPATISEDHPLIIKTSTSFFNHEGYGDISPLYSKTQATQNNTLLLDSWFSTGSSSAGYWAVTKTEDDGAENIAVANTDGLFKNTDPIIGIPLTQQDGMIALKAGDNIQALDLAPGMDLSIFKDVSQKGSIFNSTAASIGALLGVSGPTATNRVLIGQFTTNGKFEFELNVAIMTPTGNSIRYSARKDLFSTDQSQLQLYLPFLKYPFAGDATNLPPTIKITDPIDNKKYDQSENIIIKYEAADADGQVKNVYIPDIDGYPLGADSVAPFNEITISAALFAPGYHQLTAIAVDDKGNESTSDPVLIYINGGSTAPYVAISSPSNYSQHLPNVAVTITAEAFDSDGAVKSVEFFKKNSLGNDISIGKDTTTPFSIDYTETILTDTNAVFSVKAIDDKGLMGDYAGHVLLFSANTAPTVTVKTPADGGTAFLYKDTTVVVDATDNSKISLVEYFVDGKKIGEDGLAPFELIWKPAHIGTNELMAVATDDKGLKTTSVVNKVNVEKDPNGISILSADKTSILVYPNPVRDVFTYEYNAGKSGSYALYNAQGQLIQSGKLATGSGKTIEKMDMSGFAQGNYMFQLIIDGQLQSRVIIKQ
ncbi:MAG TPA: Ig-like domain-containing protein [Bacteroidia bacterium]|jgi:hypothetical protein|nr:Ig-like domain-containing protein [Bacteroidia bacterium]